MESLSFQDVNGIAVDFCDQRCTQNPRYDDWSNQKHTFPKVEDIRWLFEGIRKDIKEGEEIKEDRPEEWKVNGWNVYDSDGCLAPIRSGPGSEDDNFVAIFMHMFGDFPDMPESPEPFCEV